MTSVIVGNLCLPGSQCHHQLQAVPHGALAWWDSASSESWHCSGLPRPQSWDDKDTRSFCDRGKGEARMWMSCVDSSNAGPGGLPTRSPARSGSHQPVLALPPSVSDPSRWSSCQNRGCLFHSGSQSPKGEQGGLNACVWTQAIIPNYSFSFEPARPAGEPAEEQAP